MSKSFRLVVVDANEEVGLLMRLHLERAGHQVTGCRTGGDVLGAIGKNSFQLVLLDDHLPDMGALKVLQALAGEAHAPPVLLMTATGDEKLATQAFVAGAIDYLVKDSALAFLQELPDRVQGAVTRHRNHQGKLHAQKMQSVGRLAGGVAHEFNNLLAGIQGYAALGLREDGISADLKRYLQRIVELSGRGANLTRQLLAFARQPALMRHGTNLANLVTATADVVRRTMGIDVQVEVPTEGDPLEALADANQLQQVLVSLALNARDALTEPEPILFRLERLRLNDKLQAFPDSVPAGDFVVLEVRDKGKGMTPALLEHAFDPFFTTKEIGHGAGLGLPVAMGIVQGHDGHLTVDAREEGGTSVRVFLPRLVNGQ
jgi:signal transduction histidine kinase